MPRLILILAVAWAGVLPALGCFASPPPPASPEVAGASSGCEMPCCGGMCCCVVEDRPTTPMDLPPATPPAGPELLTGQAWPPAVVAFELPAAAWRCAAHEDADARLDRRSGRAALPRLCRWLT